MSSTATTTVSRPSKAPSKGQCISYFSDFIDGQKQGLRDFYKDDTSLDTPATTGKEMIGQLLALGCKIELAKQLSLLTLYDVVMLIDDSSSMERHENGNRIKTLEKTLEEITNIYDLANPDGILSVKFLNAENGKSRVKRDNVKNVFHRRKYMGVTRIGTELKKKVLNRFVWGDNATTKPLIVIIVTDGEIESERPGLLYEVILECYEKLKADPGRHEHAVAIHFCRVGNNEGAAKLLESLDKHPGLGSYIDCLPVTDSLEKLSDPVEKWPVLAKLLMGAFVEYWDRDGEDYVASDDDALEGVSEADGGDDASDTD